MSLYANVPDLLNKQKIKEGKDYPEILAKVNKQLSNLSKTGIASSLGPKEQ